VRYALEQPEYVEVIGDLLRGPDPIVVSSINLGEVHYTVARRKGLASAEKIWDDICNRGKVEAPTLELTRNAARIALTSRIPWADAHAAATAIAHGGVLWCGDKHLNKPGPWKRLDLRKPGMPPRTSRMK